MLNFEVMFRTSGAQPSFVSRRHSFHGRFDLTFYSLGLALFFLLANLMGRIEYGRTPNMQHSFNNNHLFLQKLLNAVTCMTSAHAATLDFLFGFGQLI